MNRDEITYGVIGVITGLVFGFFVANWTATDPTGVPSTTGAPASASVNSSSAEQELPPGHPPIDPSQPVQAPPLPEGGRMPPSGMPGTAPPPSTASAELPSLDPLPASSREERAEQKYKNIQVLKGLPADRIEPIMESFRSALGVDCTYCHIQNQFEKDDKAMKQVARRMISLTRSATAQVGGAARVTCYTCHRGQSRPPSQ